MQLIITSTAELDLEVIEEFIASDNPTAAVRSLDLLSNRFEKLAEMPRMGRR